jgi:hypothetical protein
VTDISVTDILEENYPIVNHQFWAGCISVWGEITRTLILAYAAEILFYTQGKMCGESTSPRRRREQKKNFPLAHRERVARSAG